MCGSHKRRFVSGYPPAHGVRTYLAVARGHANLFFIDEIGADSSAYEFLINAPLTRGRVGNCDVKNIRAHRFYSEPARLLYDPPVNGKRAHAEFRFPFPRC